MFVTMKIIYIEQQDGLLSHLNEVIQRISVEKIKIKENFKPLPLPIH